MKPFYFLRNTGRINPVPVGPYKSYNMAVIARAEAAGYWTIRIATVAAQKRFGHPTAYNSHSFPICQ